VLFIGCYTTGAGGDGAGISLVERDAATGALRPTAVVPTPAPSYLTRHPTRPILYAANELDAGTVTAFAVDGGLSPIDSWPSGGSLPCHLNVDAAGRHLLVANYGSGTVAVFQLDDDGVPARQSDVVEHSGRGPHPQHQTGPHAHAIVETDGQFLAIDLGADTVFRYDLDPADGSLSAPEVAFRTPAGTGPRHMAGDRDRLYLVGELDGTLTCYDGRNGSWTQLSRIPSSVETGALPSEIAIHDGYLYLANRGPDTLAVFDPSTLDLIGEVPAGGRWPRHFAFAGEFMYVANERSHTVVTFRIDPGTGLPFPTGDMLAAPSPTCVLPWP
jgi:6-phosphogluconolactonase